MIGEISGAFENIVVGTTYAKRLRVPCRLCIIGLNTRRVRTGPVLYLNIISVFHGNNRMVYREAYLYLTESTSTYTISDHRLKGKYSFVRSLLSINDNRIFTADFSIVIKKKKKKNLYALFNII